MKNVAFALLALLALLDARPVWAQADCPEHGKINTPDASPVDAGHYEVEAVYSYGSTSHSWSKNGKLQSRGFYSQHRNDLSATAGLFTDFDVTVSGNYSWLRDKEDAFDEAGVPLPRTGRGFGDVKVSGRYRFFQSEPLALDVAYIGGFTFPSGKSSDADERGSGQGYGSFDQTLVASKNWGLWTGNADIGFALPFGDKRQDARGTFNADVAGGYQLRPWLQPELEANYSHDFIAHGEGADVLALTFGLVMPVTDTVRVNTGVQQGVWGKNADRETVLSFAVKVAF